jgi:hypothetical protein
MIDFNQIQTAQTQLKGYMSKTTKSTPVSEEEHQAEAQGDAKEPIDSFFGNVLKIVGVKGKGDKNDRAKKGKRK